MASERDLIGIVKAVARSTPGTAAAEAAASAEAAAASAEAAAAHATMLLPEYDDIDDTVQEGFLCLHENKVYAAITVVYTSDEPWTPAHWREVPDVATGSYEHIIEVKDLIAEDFDYDHSDGFIPKGYYMTHNGELYRAKESFHTDYVWRSSDWQRVYNICDVLNSLESAVIPATEATTKTYLGIE